MRNGPHATIAAEVLVTHIGVHGVLAEFQLTAAVLAVFQRAADKGIYGRDLGDVLSRAIDKAAREMEPPKPPGWARPAAKKRNVRKFTKR